MNLNSNSAAGPAVSAIVPARNEEENVARCVESLAAQTAIHEIIVVNDQSTDRTAPILRDLAARIPKLKVVEASELPAGWVGKNYAVSLGAARASGEWFLFTDADAVHLAGSTVRALQDAATHNAALVSYSPEQELCEWWERALVPFVFVRLAEKFRYAKINDPSSKAAGANGQYLLIRRDAYDAIGGHSAIAGDVLEDVELARRAKSAGYQIYFAPGKGIARVRMYRTFSAMWQGWVKNLYPLMRDKNGGIAREVVTVFPWLPLLLIAFAPIHWALPVLGLALLAGRHATYAAILKKNHFAVAGIRYYIPAVVLYTCALAVSARRYKKGSVTWKGREYPVGMG